MSKLSTAALLALGLASVAPSHAAVTFYNNIAAFDGAAGTVVVEDFADTTLIPGLSFVSSVGSISGGRFNDRLVPGSQTTRFNFGSSINAFGGNFDLSPGGQGTGISWTISLFAGGTELLSQEVSQALTGQFFGFSSTESFTSILFTAGTQQGAAETYNLDNLRIGSNNVPEPVSLALLGLGLAGLVMSRRKAAGQASTR